MNTYKFITDETNKELRGALTTCTTDIQRLMFEVSDTATCLFLESDLYDLLVVHPQFPVFYVTFCPLAKAFLFQGKWFCDQKEVSEEVFTHYFVFKKEK